jgi:hypothetical protein
MSALALSGKDASSDTIGEELLQDIQSVFKTKRTDSISSSDLCEALVGLEEKPWSTWSHGKPITMRKVAGLLGKYGIKSQTVREGEATFKGYYKASFEDAWERYLFSSPENPASKGNNVTTPMDKGETPDFQKVTDPLCDTSKNGTSANPGAGCDGVTLQNQDLQGEEEKSGEMGADLFEVKEAELHVDI